MGSSQSAARLRTLLPEPGAAELLQRTGRLVNMALHAPMVLLGVAMPEGVRVLPGVGLPENWPPGGLLPADDPLCRHVLAAVQPVVIDDTERDPLTRDDPPSDPPRRAYCGMVLRVDGEPVAVLAALDAQPRRWTHGQVTMLREIGADLLRDLEQLAEREAPGAEPAASQGDALPAPSAPTPGNGAVAQWRALFEDTGSAIFMTAPDGRLVETNRATARLVACVPEDVQELNLFALIADAGERARIRHELDAVGTVEEAEVRIQRCDGATLHCLISIGTRKGPEGQTLGYHGMLRDITEQKNAEQRLLESAFRDPLTELPNRALLLDRLERLLRYSKRRAGHRFAVLFIDLDRFKAVNDTHGHLAGDRLLINVAGRLQQCIRQEDTVARIGGDEFAILLDGIGDVNGVVQVAERIIQELGEPFGEHQSESGIGASIGIALSSTGYDSIDEILRHADTAMYRAKSAGRASYAIFDTEMHTRMRAQLQLETELRYALQRNQLAVHYQPVVALEGGTVTGMEALVRWAHPDRGILLPREFIPLAEKTGVIVEIGWWVLREACRQLRLWQVEYPESTIKLTMSVNLSARQFLHPNLVQKIDAILQETGLAPEFLRLDLTEAVVTQDTQLAGRLMNQLRERGIEICIDDFGTGFSSLAQLRELPISMLKIAPSFVHDLADDEGDGHAIVQTIIAIGRSMAIDAIAEGVETPEQVEQLRALGTRFAQGFLFSLPLDAERASTLLAS